MAEGKIVIDREHLKNLLVKEEQLFDELHPKSKALFNKAKENLNEENAIKVKRDLGEEKVSKPEEAIAAVQAREI